jgi:hypothetical protein
MKPALYNINIEQGADWELSFTLKNADGQPIDLTGQNVSMQIKETFASKYIVNIFNQEINGYDVCLQLTSQVTSQIKIDIKKLVWANERPAQPFIYDIYLKKIDGRRMRIMQGKAFIYPGVTI